MSFYEYHQNNSGGSFDFDKTMGLTHYADGRKVWK